MRRVWFLWIKGWPAIALAILLLIIWEFAARVGQIPPYILPSPTKIWETFYEASERMAEYTWETFKMIVSGFVIGCFTGVLMASLMHLAPFIRRVLYPYLILSQNIPIIALAPILVTWFSLQSQAPHFIIIILVCFFPVTMSGLTGFALTDQMMLNYMQMSGATRFQIFSKLEFPHALPSIFSGFKIAAAYSVMGAVIAEWSVGGYGKGIANYMKLSQSSYNMEGVFVSFAIIVMLSLAMVGFIRILEAYFLRWHTAFTHSKLD